MTHGDAGGGVEGGDDPVRGVDVGLVDVVLAPVPRVDWVEACEEVGIYYRGTFFQGYLAPVSVIEILRVENHL